MGLASATFACAERGAERDAPLELTPLYRIGQVEGPPEVAFGRIASIVPMADGGFLTCDLNDQLLRRYDSTGSFVQSIGRRGAGPGEYASCYDTALSGDTAIVVSDPQNGRFTFFQADGTFDRVLSVSVAPGFGGPGMFLIAEDGRIWKRGMLPQARPAEGEGEFGRTQFVILDPVSGARVDSVLVPGGAESRLGRGFVLSTSEGMYAHLPPDSVWTVTPSGTFVAAGTDAYRIQVRTRDGSVREIVRAADPVPYATDERAEWEAWRAYFAQQNPAFPPAAAPEAKAILRGVLVDDSGRLWVHLHVPAEQRPIPPRAPGDPRPLLTWRERNTYDLLELGTGAFLGRVAFPYATELTAVRGDRVWLREEGESGETVIGVYALRQATGRD